MSFQTMTERANHRRRAAPPPDRPALVLQNYAPPAEIDAESWLLACMMLFPEELTRWTQDMEAADFYRPHNAALFGVLKGFAATGGDLNAVTAVAACKAAGTAEECGGAEYVNALFLLDAYQKSAGSYAALVKESARKRRMAETAVAILEAAGGGASAGEMANLSETLVLNTPLLPGEQSRSARDILRDLTDKLEEQATNPRALMGLTTGLSCVDRMTNGLQAPDMIVLGARPGVGKSALMSGVAAHITRGGEPVLIFSMEMSQEQVMTRMVCADARLDSRRLRSGLLGQDEWNAYANSARWLYDAPLVINDRSGVTPAYMRAEIRKFIRRYGRVSLICVDYLQLMRADVPTSSRYQELTEVSIELKGMAREFDVPLLALSQLSRESAKRDNKRPALADIRETGQIEQDADVVIFIHRPDQLTPDGAGYGTADFNAPAQSRDAELIFAKQRNGPQGIVRADFVDQFALFLDRE